MPKENHNRTGMRRISASAAVVLVLLAGAAALTVLLLAGPPAPMGASAAGRTFQPGIWIASALTSRMFIICALVAVCCVAGLVLLGGMLWVAGARNRGRPRGQEGAAILEFVMVLPIGLMLVLVMAQSSLLMVGNLCVNYAAYCAARSAVVQVPENLVDEPPNYVDPDRDSSRKFRRIHLAAVWAVMPVSCSTTDIPEGNAGTLTSGLDALFGSFGKDTPGWVHEYLGRKLQYAEDYTEVELVPPVLNKTHYGVHEDLRVRVHHTFYMAVPFAGRLFALLGGDDGVELDFGSGQSGEYGILIHTVSRLTNEGVRDYVEPERFQRPS